MKYVIENDRIIIYSKDEFCPKHILECGQIFSYKNDGKNYIVYSNEYMAKIIENNDNIEIITPNTDYFVNFFDLSTDYNEIKNKLWDTLHVDICVSFVAIHVFVEHVNLRESIRQSISVCFISRSCLFSSGYHLE